MFQLLNTYSFSLLNVLIPLFFRTSSFSISVFAVITALYKKKKVFCLSTWANKASH